MQVPVRVAAGVSGSSNPCTVSVQAVRSQEPDVLRMFDYGTVCRSYFDLPRPCNQAVYGQSTAPAYNLSAIKTPLVLFTGKQHCPQ